MANGARRNKPAGEAAMPDPIEVLVWIFFAVALLGTLYCLMREDPEGSQATVAHRAQERTQAQVRMLSLVVAALGAGCGLWQVFRHGGAQNLFAMAVLFNIILACFWGLRFLIGVPS